ncbi:EAL domain-containing protein [Persephonella atlantica]|uniref:EAL domain-containing protein n=1 Tax=Persephonella atlantica TaxID=2699429 RepID=A0ABS1GFT8_9AQUI|nr:EAL domain-containing protein [Persephonella atlantica]MBK3331792.1 EAL domain-containing protein [Persephonella atlantica]
MDNHIFENILLCIPDILIVSDGRGEIIFSNEKPEKISHIIKNSHIETAGKKLSISDILKSKNPQQFSNKTAVFLDKTEKRYFHIVISTINLDGNTRFVILLRDITDLKQKEENLNLYKTIFENTLDAIGIVDDRGIYVAQNKSNEELLGYKIEEIKDKHFSEILKIKNPDEVWDQLKKKGRLRFLGSSVDKSGKEKFFDIVAITVKDTSGRDKYYVGIKRDITDLIKREKELEKLNRQLKKRLYTDPLTDLPNRIKLIEDIKSVASPKLAILNIDDFKEINDFYGYQVGDFVLKKLGETIKSLLPEKGFRLYRLSGDEFGILSLRFIQSSEFEKIINGIIYYINEHPVIYKDNEIHISLTAGISLENHNILNKADMALKYAKENKKPVVYYKAELQIKELYETNILMTRKIKDALKNNRITVYYQPIFSNKTGKIERFESLVRMVDVDGTIILPSQFLEISKKARLYSEIAKKVIKTSFENFKNANVGFSINLSVKDIQNREITELIFEYLSSKDYNGNVVFEILESEGIENYREVSGFIKEVKNLGGKISIDDFGSGYSNFEYILKLDVDFIKIDSSLIKNIDSDIYSQIIVETIVGFAQKLGIQTIAEFVHSEDVYETVKNLGIDYSQGFFLGKPQPFEQLSE